ncbi:MULTISPECIES: Rrf2 family transcriptional regulator [unclassified Sphingopyxis]|jgi:Rrf2 family protein|uniref:RrF2 family transcriptional regulator n=1 Tax=unclassified Sphingopyxis TaxID=2614943 RepID=UPI000730F1D8|nr:MULTISPECIES: Rrf2 family transcriptional regulator [unclassified Sphingopyxis]KTE24085.1 transcriptional regulator [Sphingopyxis sp. H057]KTE50383.1 transcriptional regulator [Sphingopyxis sp. H073]KTE52472.1 transcriptional regulator [Sphingopyxis sp. H071]KTE62965.1 transcriptional regulator [Sphingopyxis sp. H107]KTE64855.1 transcriptional regulator [Sphingopyxis sp. H100]
MAHLTASVEYGIHCLLWLVAKDGKPISCSDLAELQGVSPSFLAKIFPKLEKAGIVRASEGVRGGYLLAQPADEISFLNIVDAIEGKKPLFDCQEIRGRCALFGGQSPVWVSAGTCAIHAVMLQAEQAMRERLASQSLGSVHRRFIRKAPEDFVSEVAGWIEGRLKGRDSKARKLTRDAPS